MTPKQKWVRPEPTEQPETDWAKFAPAVLDSDFDELEQAEFVAWRFPERANER